MSGLEEFGRRIDEEVAKLKRIHNFEDFGKRVDDELTRLKAFVKEDIAPETEKRMMQFLREVSEKLTEATSWLEERKAERDSQKAQKSSKS